jgi:arsenate reductase
VSHDVTLYHNPHCSKSRETLKLLKDNKIIPTIINYLEMPPDEDTLNRIIEMLGIEEPRDLMRQHENEYKENNLDNPTLSKAQLIQAMVNFPRLIERPIVIANGKAIIGRPPKKVLDIAL